MDPRLYRSPPAYALHPHGPLERRRHIRIDTPLAARMRTIDITGARFGEAVSLRNLSAQGLLAPLSRPVALGSACNALINMWIGERHIGRGLVLAIRGDVVRCDLAERVIGQPLDMDARTARYLVAVQFDRHRLFAVDRTRWPDYTNRV